MSRCRFRAAYIRRGASSRASTSSYCDDAGMNVGGMTSRCSKISGSRHDECWCARFKSTNDRFATVSDQGSVIESDRPFFTSTESTIIIILYSMWNISFDIHREISTIHGLPAYEILPFGMSRNISFDIRQRLVQQLYSSWNVSFDIRREISTIHGLPAMRYYHLVCRGTSHLTFVRD